MVDLSPPGPMLPSFLDSISRFNPSAFQAESF